MLGKEATRKTYRRRRQQPVVISWWPPMHRKPKERNASIMRLIFYTHLLLEKGWTGGRKRLTGKELLVTGKTTQAVTETVGKKTLDSSSGGHLEHGCVGRNSRQQKEGNGWTAGRRKPEHERSRMVGRQEDIAATSCCRARRKNAVSRRWEGWSPER